MACPCPSPPLPNDIWLHIFSLLPAKYIFRLRCISKSWKALVSLDCRPHTIRKPLPTTMAGLFYRDKQENKIKFTSLGLRTYVDVSSIDTTLSFLPPSLLQHDLHIADCCYGMLLLEDSGHLYVCNPATWRWAQTPKPWEEYTWKPVLHFHPHCSLHFMIISFPCGDDPGFIRVFSSDTGEWRDSEIMITCRERKGTWVYREEVQRKKARCPFVNKTMNGDALDYTFKIYDEKETTITVSGSHYDHSIEETYHCFYQEVDKCYMTKSSRFNHEDGDDDEDGERCDIHGECFGQSQGRWYYCAISSGEVHVWVLDDPTFCEPVYGLKHRKSVETMLGDKVADYGSDADLEVVAVHPDLDVIFMRLKEKLFSCHLSTAKLEEMCEVKGNNHQAYFAYSPCFIENLSL